MRGIHLVVFTPLAGKKSLSTTLRQEGLGRALTWTEVAREPFFTLAASPRRVRHHPNRHHPPYSH